MSAQLFNVLLKSVTCLSFLGYGLMSARLSILQTESLTTSTNQLQSVCVPENTTTSWKQQNTEYTISGHATIKQNFDGCYNSVLKIIENKLNAPNDLKNKNIYAFSLYYDQLLKSGAIDEEGGSVDLNLIAAKAKDGKKIS